MAIKTVTVGSGGSDYEAGWKQLTIKNAKYDHYNGNKFMDIWFEDYPDNLNARVYETVNKTTKEEFRISSWFRFGNAGIQEIIEYARIWREPAPVVMDTDQLSYTEKDVSFWKTRSERGLSSWQQARNGESETSVEAVVQSITDLPEDAPF